MSSLHPIWPHSHRTATWRAPSARIASLTLRRVAWCRAMRRWDRSSDASGAMSKASPKAPAPVCHAPSRVHRRAGWISARIARGTARRPGPPDQGSWDRRGSVALTTSSTSACFSNVRVAAVALDDVLAPAHVVTGHDRQPPRVASNAPVLGPAEADELVVSEASALADERDHVLRAVGAASLRRLCGTSPRSARYASCDLHPCRVSPVPRRRVAWW